MFNLNVITGPPIFILIIRHTSHTITKINGAP